jgi:hypothetical protein
VEAEITVTFTTEERSERRSHGEMRMVSGIAGRDAGER